MDKETVEKSRAIEPLHPAFDGESFTVEDCYIIGISLGINPDVIGGIITGRLLPNDSMIEELCKFFDKEKLLSVINDYKPDRWFEFYQGEHPEEDFRIDKKMNVSDLRSGDHILCTDDRWLVISDIIKDDKTCKIHSGGYFCLSTERRSFVVAAINKSKRSDINTLSIEDMKRARAINDLSKDVSSSESQRRIEMLEELIRREKGR